MDVAYEKLYVVENKPRMEEGRCERHYSKPADIKAKSRTDYPTGRERGEEGQSLAWCARPFLHSSSRPLEVHRKDHYPQKTEVLGRL